MATVLCIFAMAAIVACFALVMVLTACGFLEQGFDGSQGRVVGMHPTRGLEWPSFRKAFKRPTPPRGG